MKQFYKILISLILAGLLILPSIQIQAGNKDRSGQAGASELLINPWARSSGWGGVNVAGVRGLESSFSNIAGLAYTKGTALNFTHTQYLKGSGINMFAFGVGQQIGESGALGITVVSMNFGEIDITKEDSPEGGIGTYKPSYLTIGIAYSKVFSNSITAGFNMKIVSENLADLNGQGIALDAGIQYVTGEMENIKFGITLKNIGPKMSFSGDGIAFRAFTNQNTQLQHTMQWREEGFELPTQLNIGASYDFNIPGDHRITLAGNFHSNSFTKDQFTGGLEYSLKEYVQLRAGYTYEAGITNGIDDPANRSNAFTGFSGGFTVQVPFNKEKGTNFAIDYSYRDSDHFNGTHSIGARLTL